MTRELDAQERFRRAVSRLVPDSMDALEAAIQEEFDKFLAAPSTEPTGEGRHPDDGHEHWFACIRCGVDNGLNEVADSRQSEGLPHPGENHEFRTTCQRCGEPTPRDFRRLDRLLIALIAWLNKRLYR